MQVHFLRVDDFLQTALHVAVQHYALIDGLDLRVRLVKVGGLRQLCVELWWREEW